MVLEFLTSKKGKKAAPVAVQEEAKSPVLTTADEDFLKRITEEDVANKELVLFDNKAAPSTDAMDEADKVPLPMSPPEAEVANPIDRAVETDTKDKHKKERRKSAYLSYIQKHLPFGKERNREQAASQLQDVATAVKTGESLAPPKVVVSAEEAEK